MWEDLAHGGTVRRVGTMVVATTAHSAPRLTVTGPELQGMTYLGFLVHGRAEVRAPGLAPVSVHRGEAVILTEPRDVVMESPAPARWVHVLVTTTRLRERGVPVHAGLCEKRGGALAGPVAAFASALAEGPGDSGPISDVVAARVLENLVVAVYGEAHEETDPRLDQRRRVRRAAIDLIDERFSDALLTPAAIAADVGVSLRHLQRCFEGSGTTIASEISNRRTENASMLLAAPASRELTVAEVARRSGFSSAFELRSRVRARFGVPPSELRRSGSSVGRQVPVVPP
ncbi:helix-turn-helix transcriptional regulator [Arthrobacter antioxidans]|uniref:helix-turn-helix transcriptional regulator n=1 Tax=Arthrobacter antioxidans TaxID=2895818 RepID=UPI001FFF15D4|nr:AraC family transcriptional regulator [Arthrobacter antioxidans]